jgi:hypothetical protein
MLWRPFERASRNWHPGWHPMFLDEVNAEGPPVVLEPSLGGVIACVEGGGLGR